MRRILYTYLIGCLLFIWHPVMAQKKAGIANTRIQLVGAELHIHFDIDGSSGALYEVWVEINDASGTKLDARSFSGDVGTVSGGAGKLAVWRPRDDGIFIQQEIFIQVKANSLSAQANGTAGGEIAACSRGGALLRSVAFPGWGLSLCKGGPHWLKGVAGYGCLGVAVVSHMMALDSYDLYLASEAPAEADDYLNSSIKQQNLSRGLVYTAAAIWLTDLVWTYVGTAPGGATLGAGYDAFSRSPVLTLSYTF